MNNEIKYNVKTIINKDENEKNTEKIFNLKLLKVIILAEKKTNFCQE